MKLPTVTALFLSAFIMISCGDNKPPSSDTSQTTAPPAAAADRNAIQVDEYPTPINRPSPVYPKAALEAHAEGTVWLNVVVTDSGRVRGVSVVKSTASPELTEAAIDAAKLWTFKPARKEGKAVELMVTIPFRFKLSEDDKKQK